MSKFQKVSIREIITNVQQTDKSKKGVPTFIGMYKNDEGDWVDFDVEIAPSGFTRNNIHYISGMTGNGKSERALQSAILQSIHGYKVLYITLEQTTFDIAMKMIAKADEVKPFEWKQFHFTEDKTAFDTKKQKALNLAMAYFEDEKGNSLMDLVYGSFTTKEMAEYLKKECFGQYDIIYVDNFQNCFAKEYMDYEVMTRDRGDILGTNSALVWLSQIDEKSQRTKNARALEEDAALGIRIYREKKEPSWKKEKEESGELPTVQKSPTSYLDVVKNREDGILIDEVTFPFDIEKGRIGTFELPNLKERLEQRKKAHEHRKQQEKENELEQKRITEENAKLKMKHDEIEKQRLLEKEKHDEELKKDVLAQIDEYMKGE